MNSIRVEICCESTEGAIAAQQGGADRVELCANLFEGGTTPSAGSIAEARRRLKRTKLHVILRPRGGDFLFSPTEFAILRRDVLLCRELGVDGVVIGQLTADGRIDVRRTRELIRLARPMSVTFHRAFDVSRDPLESLDALIGLGVDRVLTSGQAPSVLEGSELIAQLVKRAAGRIGILPGGGITPRNLERVVRETGVSEVHLVGWSPRESGMKYRNPDVFMGGELRPPEFSRLCTDPAIVKSIVGTARGGRKR